MTQAALALPDHGLDPVRIEVEEDIHLAWSEHFGRPFWEGATFSLRSVRVTGGGFPPRAYGPRDAWGERAADPRGAYSWFDGQLVREARPGRDYDPARHTPQTLSGRG